MGCAGHVVCVSELHVSHLMIRSGLYVCVYRAPLLRWELRVLGLRGAGGWGVGVWHAAQLDVNGRHLWE
jgi:hypothetical protein